MTQDLRDVAYNVVHDYPGGAESLGHRIGKSGTTLSHEVNGTGTAKFGLLDAEKVTQRTGDLRILVAFAGNFGQILVPLPDVLLPSDDCLLRLSDSAREFGELCGEVARDLSDGVISDNEMARIDKDCGQLIASVYALRESLAARNALAKAARSK